VEWGFRSSLYGIILRGLMSLWVISVVLNTRQVLQVYPKLRTFHCAALSAAKGHVWTYMDPARLQQADWIRCNSHNC